MTITLRVPFNKNHNFDNRTILKKYYGFVPLLNGLKDKVKQMEKNLNYRILFGIHYGPNH